MFSDKISLKMDLILLGNYDFVVCKGAIYESLPEVEPIPWPLHLEGNVLLNHILGKISVARFNCALILSCLAIITYLVFICRSSRCFTCLN